MHVETKGILVVCRFCERYTKIKRYGSNIFLKTMYVFFSLTANIETQKLIDTRPYFTEKYEMITAAVLLQTFYTGDCLQENKRINYCFRKTRSGD